MTLITRYSLALAVSVLILLAVSFLAVYQNWNGVPQGSASGAFRLLSEWTLYEACDTITHATWYLVGLTFAVGLVSSASAEGPLALTPSLLVLAVGAVVSLATMVNIYEVATTNEVSPGLVLEGGAWAVRPLAVSLALSTVLFTVVAIRAHRASYPAAASRRRASASSARPGVGATFASLRHRALSPSRLSGPLLGGSRSFGA